MDWFKKVVFENYANFSGRARRKEFWMFFLFFMILSFVTGIVAAIFVPIMGLFALLIFGLWYLALIIPTLAVTIRRFHDSGRSGWWYLANFAPFVPAIVLPLLIGGSSTEPSGLFTGLIAWLIVGLSVIISLVPIVLLFLNSEPGTNQWGPNPKEELAHHETPPPL